MDTVTFLRKRALHMAPVLFGIVLAVFLMVRLIPGDPARIMLGTHATPERIAELQTGSFCSLSAMWCKVNWAPRWSFGAPSQP